MAQLQLFVVFPLPPLTSPKELTDVNYVIKQTDKCANMYVGEEWGKGLYMSLSGILFIQLFVEDDATRG